MHACMHACMLKPFANPQTKETHIVKCPFKKDPEGSDDKSNWAYRPVHMFLPHELLEFIFDSAGVRVPEDELLKYWRSAHTRDLDWAKDFDEDRCPPRIPIKLFGDDATYNKQGDKFMAFILSCPLWRPHASRNSRWPVAVVSLYGNLGYPTLQPVLRALVESLNRSYDIPIPQTGNLFQVTEIGGDWKYLREAFNMTTHWNSPRCCHFCGVLRKNIPLLQEPTFRTTNTFIREVVCPFWPSPLILLRKFSLDAIQWCLLHTCHLGLLWTANGAAMDYLLGFGVWGSPQLPLKSRLMKAYTRFKMWRLQFRIRCSQRMFTKQMIYKTSHGAYLSAKGWNSRVLCAWLADVCGHVWHSAAHPDEELTLLSHAMLLSSSMHVLSVVARMVRLIL